MKPRMAATANISWKFREIDINCMTRRERYAHRRKYKEICNRMERRIVRQRIQHSMIPRWPAPIGQSRGEGDFLH